MTKIRLTKEEADRLMSTKANARGLFKEDIKYVLEKKGEDGLEKIRKRMEELGYPLDIKKLSIGKWYPISLACLFLAVAAEVFDWEESEVSEISYNVSVRSILGKLVLNRLTIESMLKNFQKHWNKFSDTGKCEVDYNLNDKHAFLRLKDFVKTHPIFYTYIMGFIKRATEISTSSEKVEVHQVRSILDGDAYDEIEITW
jgi:hypothetical protein